MKKWLIIFGLVVIIIRSGIYVKRILSEGVKNYYPEIDGCQKDFNWQQDDKRILYLYRNLGKVCEK